MARAALDAGAALVNDVRGARRPRAWPRVVAGAGVAGGAHAHAGHARRHAGAGRLPATWSPRCGPSSRAALAPRRARPGVGAERIVLDPGIGFAKTAGQSVELLARLAELLALGRPLLVGPSRKSFIGALTGAPAEERLPGHARRGDRGRPGRGRPSSGCTTSAAARQAALVAAALRAAGRSGASG